MTNFTGTLALTRVALRRDRVQLSVWILVIAGLVAGFAAVVADFVETQEDIAEFTSLYVTNPTMRLFGLASEVSIESFTVTRSWIIWALLVSLMSSLAVVRHTRQNEDTRCAELIHAGVVGRDAFLASALIVVVIANVLVAVLSALGLMANGLPAHGSFATGASLGALGIAFGGIGAVAAQLSSSARGANGLAAAALGLLYLLAGVGNMLGTADEAAYRVSSAWPAWLSPLGWAQQMRPYADANWWILLLFAAFFVVMVAVAIFLAGRRDLGRGLISERRGPATASAGLLNPLGLAFRLQRGILLGWIAGVAAYGVVFGMLSNEIEGLFEDLEQGAEILERVGGTDEIAASFYATVMGIIGSLVAVYALQVLLRMRAEEDEGTLEAVLATSMSRWRWSWSWVANAAAGTVILLFVAGLTIGTASGIVMEDLSGQLGSMLEAAMVQIPATLVIAAVVVAAFGLLPRRAAAVSWFVFGIAVLTGPVVGGLLELPGWLRDISPFSHTPLAPAAEVTLLPIAILLAVAGALALAGLVTFRRRDVARTT